LEVFNELLALGDTFTTNVPVYPIDPLLTNDYIIGFINGEASFTNVSGMAKFAIEHTDGKVINMINRHLNFSTNVYSPTKRTNRKQTFALSVTNSYDLAKIIDFINSNYPLQGYKLIQYNY
jgi:hypothetical protein